MRWLLTVSDKLLLWLATVCFAGFLICVSLQVFFRYMLEQPLPWSEEVAVYLFIWSSFLAAAVLVGRNEHFVIPVFVDRLPARAQWLLEIMTLLLCLGFCTIIVLRGSAWSYRMLPFFTSILQISQGAMYAVLPFSGLYMILHLVMRLTEILRQPAKER